MRTSNVRGAFGRQARFRHGPLALVRTAHPVTGDFLQLCSATHKYNLLQYLFTPAVSSVVADRQQPIWVRAQLSRNALRSALCVTLTNGAQLVVQMRRTRGEENFGAPAPIRLASHLWLMERTTAEIERQSILNRNLEEAGQLLNSHCDDEYSIETRTVMDVLRHAGSVAFREVVAFAALRVGLTRNQLKVVLARLLLARQIGVDLAAGGWGDDTTMLWGDHGVGYAAPIPAAILDRGACA